MYIFVHITYKWKKYTYISGDKMHTKIGEHFGLLECLNMTHLDCGSLSFHRIVITQFLFFTLGLIFLN